MASKAPHFYHIDNDEIILHVHLTPNSSRSEIKGLHDIDDGKYIKTYVNALPEDNKANKALIKLISKSLKIAKSKIEIISGFKSRLKIVKIAENNENILRYLNSLE